MISINTISINRDNKLSLQFIWVSAEETQIQKQLVDNDQDKLRH